MSVFYFSAFVAGVLLSAFNFVKMFYEVSTANITERAWYSAGYFFIGLVNLVFWYAG